MLGIGFGLWSLIYVVTIWETEYGAIDDILWISSKQYLFMFPHSSWKMEWQKSEEDSMDYCTCVECIDIGLGGEICDELQQLQSSVLHSDAIKC